MRRVGSWGFEGWGHHKQIAGAVNELHLLSVDSRGTVSHASITDVVHMDE